MLDKTPRILVLGYRKGLIQALRDRGYFFSLWHDKPANTVVPGSLLIAPFSHTAEIVRKTGASFLPAGSYTHVIAGTEQAVYAASVMRRLLGCRLSKITVILRCRDKLKMKQYLQKHRIPMTDFISHPKPEQAPVLLQKLGSPVVVKERTQSGGRGVSFHHDADSLRPLIKRNKIFERYVDAEEASVESFVNHGRILFTNITQYVRKAAINLVPGDIAPAVAQSMLDLNRKIIEALHIQWGLTHTEMYLTKNGPLFGEIALRPPGGYIMDLISDAYGINAWHAFIAMELDEPFDFPARPRQWAAAYVYHAGAGTVAAVHGIDQLQELGSVKKASVRVIPGDSIAARRSVSDESAHILYQNTDLAALKQDLEQTDRVFSIDVRDALIAVSSKL